MTTQESIAALDEQSFAQLALFDKDKATTKDSGFIAEEGIDILLESVLQSELGEN